MKKQTPNDSKNIELENLRHFEEYSQFIAWMAMSSELRSPKTQGEFAKKFGVGPDTLSDWKKRPGFYESVKKKRKDWCKEKTPEVISSLYKKIQKTGSAQEVKLWFQLFEDWSERIETNNKSDRPFEQLTDEELAEYIRERKKFLLKK